MPDTTLTLPDGTTYPGRLQHDDDGRPIVDMAECGTCGFTWNDALITSLTPVPGGRTPCEWTHDDPAEDDDGEPRVYAVALEAHIIATSAEEAYRIAGALPVHVCDDLDGTAHTIMPAAGGLRTVRVVA
jgi:hypothetical protein